MPTCRRPAARRRLAPLASLTLAFALLAGACADPTGAPPGGPRLDVEGDLASTLVVDDDTSESVVHVTAGPDDVVPGDEVAAGAQAEGAEEAEMGFAAFAATPQMIRIGVVHPAASVAVGGTAGFQIRNKTTNALLVSSAAEQLTVTLGSSTVTTQLRRLQVMCTTSIAQRDARLAAGAAAGYPTFTESPPGVGCWRVYVGELPANAPAAQQTAYRNGIIALGLAASDSFWRIFTIITGVTQYRIARGATQIAVSNNPILVTPLAGKVLIGGRQYRGVGEVRQNASFGNLSGINELPMEEYLWGVVPRELGPIAFPELEALKAQAVAARTYAYANLNKRATDGFNLVATTSDQVYGGFQDEHPLSTQAVDETAGLVLMHGTGFADALYHSTSGGFTANNEEAFTGAPAPYLRGLPDRQLGQAVEHVPTLEVFRNHGNATNLRAAREGDFESNWSRLHRWTVSWTAAEIRSALTAWRNGADVGTVHAINVLDRGPSGRAQLIEYVTDAGTFTDTKDRIRSSLRYYDAAGAIQSLRSTLVFIEPVIDPSSKQLVGFRGFGGGWGHGVGMSQTGAVGMAEKGATFREILSHYYQGTTLEQR